MIKLPVRIKSLRLLEVEEIYEPSIHVSPIFYSVGADSGGLFTVSEASDIVFRYIEKEDLVKQTDKSWIILDPVLCDALFNGTVEEGSTYPTEIHKKDLGPIFVNRVQPHHKGNKKVTRVSGFETFLMDAESLASELQKKFACSMSVAELPVTFDNDPISLRMRMIIYSVRGYKLPTS
ncbi:hypothetical protein Ancab_038495 [Ancistrocladus abbreviatus]